MHSSLRFLCTSILAALVCGAAPAAPPVQFRETARASGIDFLHRYGGSGMKYLLETMGSGGCFLDYDGDGDDDLFLAQGAPLRGHEGEGGWLDALYRNDGVQDGIVQFHDVSRAAGIGDLLWTMGCTAGDVDGDGDPDLLMTNHGPDVLYRNDGDGRFTDVSVASGIAGEGWSASAAFGDADRDGDLDLFVTHYVDFTVDNHKICEPLERGHPSYCEPQVYNPVPDTFFRNRGDGTFEDATGALGPVSPANGLGIIWGYLDDDDWPDIYVTNDAQANHLLINRGDGTFRDRALVAGAAVSEDGIAEAGMGIEAADVDGDLRLDLFVTHLTWETNTLYHNLGDGRFVDWSFPSGVGAPSVRFLAFGTGALDFDRDGDLDLLVANGHFLDDAARFWEEVTYAQPLHLLENDGSGRFREVGAAHGAVFAGRIVGRGLAFADLDHDGDQEALVTISRDHVRLLVPDGAPGAWMQIDVERAGGGPAVGARILLQGSEQRQVREVRTASSYLSQSSMTIHAGLGAAATASLQVRSPAGSLQRFAGLPTDRRYRLRLEAP